MGSPVLTSSTTTLTSLHCNLGISFSPHPPVVMALETRPSRPQRDPQELLAILNTYGGVLMLGRGLSSKMVPEGMQQERRHSLPLAERDISGSHLAVRGSRDGETCDVKNRCGGIKGGSMQAFKGHQKCEGRHQNLCCCNSGFVNTLLQQVHLCVCNRSSLCTLSY